VIHFFGAQSERQDQAVCRLHMCHIVAHSMAPRMIENSIDDLLIY